MQLPGEQDRQRASLQAVPLEQDSNSGVTSCPPTARDRACTVCPQVWAPVLPPPGSQHHTGHPRLLSLSTKGWYSHRELYPRVQARRKGVSSYHACSFFCRSTPAKNITAFVSHGSAKSDWSSTSCCCFIFYMVKARNLEKTVILL